MMKFQIERKFTMMINIFEGGRRAAKVILSIMFAAYMVTLWFMKNDDEKLEFSIVFAFCYGGFHLLTMAIGWIVRGIFGIPSGQDFPSGSRS